MDQDEKGSIISKEVDSLRNLRPKTFAIATDHEADIKERWSAFDELYEAVREGIAKKGHDPDDVLLSPNQRAGMVLVEGGPAVTEADEQRCMRTAVAMMLNFAKYNYDKQAINEIMIQAEALVPTPPDPNTGEPRLSLKDQALLCELTHQMRTVMPEDWDAFYKGDSVPAAQRKLAFQRMYAVIGKVWLEASLFPHKMTPENRQKFIIFAFMCHVPGDQWGEEDLKELHADLLPIEEPDWNDERLFGPRDQIPRM